MIGHVGYLQKECVEPLFYLTIWLCLEERKGKQCICKFLSVSCLIGQSSPHGALTLHLTLLEKAESLWAQIISLGTIVACSGGKHDGGLALAPRGRGDNLWCQETRNMCWNRTHISNIRIQREKEVNFIMERREEKKLERKS